MGLVQIINHAAIAVSRLAAQFANAVLLKGLVSALGDEIQNTENGLYGLLVTRDLANANDATLDKLGLLLGAPVRGLMDNTEYRARVLAQVLINRSKGSAAEVYAIAPLIVLAWNAAGQPKITETGECCYTIQCAPLAVPLLTPVAAFGAQVTTGGSLHNGVTVAYRVTALSATGETLASTEITRTLTGVTNTNTQAITWGVVTRATGYKVYGRTTGAELLIATVTGNGTLSYVDTGSITPSGALPVAATATYAAPISLRNDDAEARQLAHILNDASSAGVRAIVESRSDTVADDNFFRFAGSGRTPAGFDVGKFKAAYDK